MALNLSIIKSPTNAALSSHQKTFSEQGGTLGRGESNDWVLADPDRFLSSRHCALSFEGGQFYVTDTSTNGTFVNGAAEPLGKGGKALIVNGDTLELGDYQFRAELEGAGAGAASDPFESLEPTSTRDQGSGALPDPFASPMSAAPDPFASDPFGVSEPLSLNPDNQEVDPLAALDGAGSSAGSPFTSPAQHTADPFGGFGSEPRSEVDIFGTPSIPEENDDFLRSAPTHSDGANAMSQSIDWPEAKGESLIPDDWDDDFLGASSDPAPMGLEPQVPVSKPALEPIDDPLSLQHAHKSIPLTDPPKHVPRDAKPLTSGREPSAGLREPAAPREALLSERSPEPVEAFEPRPSQSPQPAAKVNSSPGRAPSSAAAGDALLAGLGLKDRDLTEEQLVELYATIGELIPVIITGMMQVLRSRASIKNEFRMNVTTIQPIENNPLKFSADAYEAIENMFIRKSGAYMGSKQAFQEGFDGIGEHQVAIIAGIRAAFKSMMERFDPQMLERQFEKQTKGGILPGMQKAKMWSSYSDHYKGFVDNMENTFQYLFGDEFVQAYEEQLRRLSAERKKKR